MNKKFLKSVPLFFSALILSFVSASCSNADHESVQADENPTLRYTANTMYDSTVWTEALEVDRLTTNISAVSGISSRLNLNPLIVAASKTSDSERVFPVLGSFGSLDTTLISKPLREMLTSFSEAVSKNKDADSFMSKDCLYSLALFYTDFNRIFGECFELNKGEEPSSEESSLEPVKSEANSTPEGTEAETEKVPEEKLYFTSFVFGQPFLDGVCYEVPVKFFSEKAVLTLSVFCAETSGSWKIDQIQIADWEIFGKGES